MTRTRIVLTAFLALLSAAFGLIAASSAQDRNTENQSAVVTIDRASREDSEWGSFFTYYSGQTHATEAVLSGVAELKPGLQIHPPHAHSEEEYLMVLEGSGQWHLNGREFPATKGDMLYASPWDVHGIRNTGRAPLKFVVWKYAGKGVAAPAKPKDGP